MPVNATYKCLYVGALLLSFALGGSASAQVTTTPDTIFVSLAEGEVTEVPLTVSNVGADSYGFALSLAPAPSADDPPEEPGTVLFTSENTCCGLNGITTTPGGRLFVERGRETYEFTPELDFVREFEGPRTQFITSILGVTYDADRETLWWLDVQDPNGIVTQALLLEGALEGTATGKRLPAFWDESYGCNGTGFPAYVAYDAVATAATTGGTGLFYYHDIFHDTVWAVDTLGQVAEGYPYRMTDYAGVPQPFNPGGCVLGFGMDAHALGGEPVLESLAGYPFQHPRNRSTRIVVTDCEGRNRGAETSLFDLPVPDGFGAVLQLNDVVRSRLDPSVLYVVVITGRDGSLRSWVYAVRAAPLPPPWLHATPILFGVAANAETDLTLSLDATGLELGVYEAVASVRQDDGIGPVLVEVPVVLTVTPPVGTEDEASAPASVALGEVYPNPATGGVTVPLTLEHTVEVALAVFDVLGREIGVLHDRVLGAGEHTLRLDTSALPSGVYVVHLAAEGRTATKRFTVVQ